MIGLSRSRRLNGGIGREKRLPRLGRRRNRLRLLCGMLDFSLLRVVLFMGATRLYSKEYIYVL